MQLSKKEYFTIKNMIDDYKNVYNKICELEDEMKKCHETQIKLEEHLRYIRENEKRFSNKLEERYGPGKLNAATLEYETK